MSKSNEEFTVFNVFLMFAVLYVGFCGAVLALKLFAWTAAWLWGLW